MCIDKKFYFGRRDLFFSAAQGKRRLSQDFCLLWQKSQFAVSTPRWGMCRIYGSPRTKRCLQAALRLNAFHIITNTSAFCKRFFTAF
jgi:hypothetical protein